MDGKKEYIERGALIDAIESTDWYHIGVKGNLVHGAISDGNALYKADDVFEVLNKLPVADVASVVHGEWIEQVKIARKSNINPLYYYQCSLCGVYLAKRANYCPNCGAKMDGGQG